MMAHVSEFFAAFLIAAPLSYLAATFFESLFHDQILDVSAARARFYFRIRKYLPGFWNIHVAHGVLHHHRTFVTSFGIQFAGPDERERLLCKLRRSYPTETVKDFERASFGNTFTAKGVVFYTIPVYVPPLLAATVLPLHMVMGVALASCMTSFPFFVLSKWIHPYLHMPFEEALLKAPVWVRAVITSPYGVAIRISHWVHHAEPRYNMNLQYGADLIRRRFRAPTVAEWDEMLAQEIILPCHRARFEGRRFLLHPF